MNRKKSGLAKTSSLTPLRGAQGSRRRNVDNDHDADRPASPALSDASRGGDGRPAKVVCKPAQQLTMTQEELSEEFTKVLTTANSNAPQNLVRYSYLQRAYIPTPPLEQTETHLELESQLIHVDLLAKSSKKKAMERTASMMSTPTLPDLSSDLAVGSDEPIESSGTILRNQFNYSDRALQALAHPQRDHSTMTEPPPRKAFSGSVSQWEIHDAFIQDQEKRKNNKDKSRSVRLRPETQNTALLNRVTDRHSGDNLQGKLDSASKIMERMVNQNTFEDVALDFKYWEDGTDAVRESGSLLPLWRFQSPKTKKRHITSLSWNEEYSDLFAVGLGSFDFLKQQTGLVAAYSLKNPSHPEFIYPLPCGVNSVNFHRQHTSLLAAGLHDGNIVVLDLRKKLSSSNEPTIQSSPQTGKHTNPVWQVLWQEDDLAKNLNLVSVSGDGTVAGWTVVKNVLVHTKILDLERNLPADDDTDQLEVFNITGGTCIEFNKASDHLFLLGTEDGTIHKCSKAYNSQYLHTFHAHHMAVYAVRWSPFFPKVFLSASADWTVKLWDDSQDEPLLSFDLGSPAADVQWAPYSSTIFAVATADGRMVVFDLSINKHDPLCSQVITRKAQLTRLAFNRVHGIVIAGDTRGCVHGLKLSPNLRKGGKWTFDSPEDEAAFQASESSRLEAIVSIPTSS